MLKNPNYIYGPRDISIPASVNFAEFLLDNIAQFKERIAFINASEDQSITYGQLFQESIDVAVSLTQLGVRKGEAIAICSENRMEFFPAVIGASCTGAVVSPISAACSKDEMKHLMSICKPRLVFCSTQTFQLHSKTWRQLPYVQKFVVFGAKQPDAICYGDLINKNIRYQDFTPVQGVGQTDTLYVLYSSGTTGLPKGVQLTHYNAIMACSPAVETSGQPTVTSLSVSPWYHAMGFWGTMSFLAKGRTMVYLAGFSELKFLEAIHKFKPNVLLAPPPVLVMLSKSQLLPSYDVSSVVFIHTGAAPLDADTINDVKKRFPNMRDVLQGYGMTESTLAISRDSVEAPRGVKAKSVGAVAEGCVVKITDLKTGKVAGPYEKGEICVRGAVIMKGYVGLKNSEYFDEEGFFRTGDVGYFDEDKYIYIVDRLKELIKYKGFQVPPAELEAVLLQHQAVRDAAVVGKPDRSAGELPMAFVVKQPGEDVTEKELVDFVASKVSKEKRLRGGVRFVDAIPKNPSGKILRKVLRERIHKSKL